MTPTARAKDSGPNESDGIYQGGYTQGQAGAFDAATNKAVAFNGSDGFVASNHAVQQPARTTRWRRGSRPRRPTVARSSGSAARRPATSGCYDRHIYISNDGQLTFGVWTGFTNTITTPNAVNDGQWHHVVATQSNTDGMKLYVDGALVGTNGQTDAQAYAGYWRVGGDNHWGCCSPFLAGTIDEAAVYSSVLPPSTVAAHYAAGGGSVPNQAPTAAFTPQRDRPRPVGQRDRLERPGRHHRVVRVGLRVTARRRAGRHGDPHVRRGGHLHGHPHGDRQRRAAPTRRRTRSR